MGRKTDLFLQAVQRRAEARDVMGLHVTGEVEVDPPQAEVPAAAADERAESSQLDGGGDDEVEDELAVGH